MEVPSSGQAWRLYRAYVGDRPDIPSHEVFARAMAAVARRSPDLLGAAAVQLMELVQACPRDPEAQEAILGTVELLCRLNEDELVDDDGALGTLVRDIAEGRVSLPTVKRRLADHIRPWTAGGGTTARPPPASPP